jgi:hypothetical protein
VQPLTPAQHPPLPATVARRSWHSQERWDPDWPQIKAMRIKAMRGSASTHAFKY